MDKATELINARYDALMFASTRETAHAAARELVRVVLGDDALDRPLEQTLRDVCRKIRPSGDPKEQARFEAEFVELALAPSSSHHPMAA
jgi:hypothetical protein